MATFTDRDIIDAMIAGGGYYGPDPQVLRIVEYTSNSGQTCWGVVWAEEQVSINRYMRESEYIHNPKIIWQHPDL